GGIASLKIEAMEAIGLSTSTLGAGMIVGARIGIPAIVGGLAGASLKPTFVRLGWLHPNDPFRKITFIIALGMIMGAAAVDITLTLYNAVQRVRRAAAETQEAGDDSWKRTNTTRLVLWSLIWGAGTVATGAGFFHASVVFLLFAVGLVFVFVMVNG